MLLHPHGKIFVTLGGSHPQAIRGEFRNMVAGQAILPRPRFEIRTGGRGHAGNPRKGLDAVVLAQQAGGEIDEFAVSRESADARQENLQRGNNILVSPEPHLHGPHAAFDLALQLGVDALGIVVPHQGAAGQNDDNANSAHPDDRPIASQGANRCLCKPRVWRHGIDPFAYPKRSFAFLAKSTDPAYSRLHLNPNSINFR